MIWWSRCKAYFLNLLGWPPLRMLGMIALWACVFVAVAFFTLLFVALVCGEVV